MIKKKLYLDTSVPSAYYDDRQLERQKMTKEFWPRLKDYEVSVSEVTIGELRKHKNEEIRGKMLNLVKDHNVLKPSPESEVLAKAYVENGIIKERVKEDADHIAIATIAEVDYLISWNFGHLVNVKTRERVKALNILKGYKPIEIIAPPELGGERND